MACYVETGPIAYTPIQMRIMESPAEHLAALEQLRQRCQTEADPQLLDQLLQAVPAPDPSLFADVSDAPAPPPPDEQVAAAAWAAATTQHLQLLGQVAQQLSALELGLEELASESVAAGSSSSGSDAAADALPPGPVGSVFIQEVGACPEAGIGAGAPSTRARAVSAVLAAALCGGDDRLEGQRPWASAPVAAAAAQLLLALAAKLAAAVHAMQQEQQPEQQQRRDEGPVLREASSSPSHQHQHHQPNHQHHHRRQQQQPPPAEVQQFVALAVAPALQRLRPVLAAKVEHSRHKTMRLEPYSGPGDFERCIAAGQLAWLVRQLGGRHLSAATRAALPAVLAAMEDPCPAVQACALWALQHMAAQGDPADLRPHGQAVLSAAKRALAGCSEASWPAAAAAAIAVVARLEGTNPCAKAYHDVMAVLLDEGERGSHLPDRAAAWLAAAPALFPCLGPQLAAHFARLMPLLLGWCLTPLRRSVRAAALEAVVEVVRVAWQRMGVHAALVWRVLRRVHDEELQGSVPPPVAATAAANSSGAEGAATSSAAAVARAVADCAEDCGLALWFAAGADFQAQLMSGRDALQDQLLQAVMARVEESADLEGMEVESVHPQHLQHQQEQGMGMQA